MKAVTEAVARFARSERHDIWPRFTATAAGVSTDQAREDLVALSAQGLLDLWYVVLCENGDEISRHKHPERAPIGESAVCYRCDEPERFEVTEDNVYLMFSPTEQLLILAGQVDGPPKGEGAVSAPSAPSSAELARRAATWDPERGIVVLEVHHHYGDTVGGDKVGGDKVGRDKTGGDRITGAIAADGAKS